MLVAEDSKVLVVADVPVGELVSLLNRYELRLVVGHDDEQITGSFWGDSEAGIVGDEVHVRGDTPVHSFLHETCHVICMTSERRETLHQDAGGDDFEESAVCYLQVVLADSIRSLGRARMMRDMDAWGYSFRLGSTRAWFERDAEDARIFLLDHGLIAHNGAPTYTLRS